MLKLLKVAMAVCVVSLFTPAASSAAPVNFVGTVTPGNAIFAPGTPMSLSLMYTPAVGLSAVVTSAVLSIGAQTWSTLVGANTVSITTNGAAADDLSISLNFGPSTPGGFGSTAAGFTMTIFGNVDLGAAPDATEANINTIAAFGNPGSGALGLVGGVPGGFQLVGFSGSAVPEPGSIVLLSGLGLVFGRGAWKRRKLAKQQAA